MNNNNKQPKRRQEKQRKKKKENQNNKFTKKTNNKNLDKREREKIKGEARLPPSEFHPPRTPRRRRTRHMSRTQTCHVQGVKRTCHKRPNYV